MKLEMAFNKSEDSAAEKEFSTQHLNNEEVSSGKQGSKTIFLDTTGTDFERLNTHDSPGTGHSEAAQDRLHTETLGHTHTHTVETLVSVEFLIFLLIVMPLD